MGREVLSKLWAVWFFLLALVLWFLEHNPRGLMWWLHMRQSVENWLTWSINSLFIQEHLLCRYIFVLGACLFEILGNSNVSISCWFFSYWMGCEVPISDTALSFCFSFRGSAFPVSQKKKFFSANWLIIIYSQILITWCCNPWMIVCQFHALIEWYSEGTLGGNI